MPDPHGFINDLPSTSNTFMDLDDGILSHIDLADVTPYAANDNCMAFESEHLQFDHTINHLAKDEDKLPY
jgi:hypothetical protein